jgi:hypothetical protein
MADPVERNCFVLKVLDERSFKVFVQIILKKNVQRLNNNQAVRRFWRRENVASNEYFGIASASELVDDIVPLVQQAVI